MLICFCNCPDQTSAKIIAKALVEEHLAACVNMVGGINSFYCWQEKLCEEAETLLIIKTRATMFETMKARLLELHPYQVPEIIGVPIAHGHAPYLAWIEQNTALPAEAQP